MGVRVAAGSRGEGLRCRGALGESIGAAVGEVSGVHAWRARDVYVVDNVMGPCAHVGCAAIAPRARVLSRGGLFGVSTPLPVDQVAG